MRFKKVDKKESVRVHILALASKKDRTLLWKSQNPGVSWTTMKISHL
jgi:hypothetical protein